MNNQHPSLKKEGSETIPNGSRVFTRSSSPRVRAGEDIVLMEDFYEKKRNIYGGYTFEWF